MADAVHDEMIARAMSAAGEAIKAKAGMLLTDEQSVALASVALNAGNSYCRVAFALELADALAATVPASADALRAAAREMTEELKA